MIIDCDTCEVRGQACDDCVVGVLLGQPTVLDAEQRRALAVLSDSGLVPPLRLVEAAKCPISPSVDDDVTDDTPDQSTRAV
jgi:hypothetical protein